MNGVDRERPVATKVCEWRESIMAMVGRMIYSKSDTSRSIGTACSVLSVIMAFSALRKMHLLMKEQGKSHFCESFTHSLVSYLFTYLCMTVHSIPY